MGPWPLGSGISQKPMSTLTAIVDDKIWALDRPVWFSGARLRARTTVVRLDDGSLLLHTPPPPTDEFVESLRALGPVRWLVVPNCWHHLGAPAAAAHFADAQVVGPASAVGRNEALKLHLDIRGARFGEQVPELEALPLDGVPFWDETVLYHRPTQTLLGADIVWLGERERPLDVALWRAPDRLLRAGARPARRP